MNTTSAPSAFHVLTKPTGAICNLDGAPGAPAAPR
jgi:hypothetical protein